MTDVATVSTIINIILLLYIAGERNVRIISDEQDIERYIARWAIDVGQRLEQSVVQHVPGEYETEPEEIIVLERSTQVSVKEEEETEQSLYFSEESESAHYATPSHLGETPSEREDRHQWGIHSDDNEHIYAYNNDDWAGREPAEPSIAESLPNQTHDVWN